MIRVLLAATLLCGPAWAQKGPFPWCMPDQKTMDAVCMPGACKICPDVGSGIIPSRNDLQVPMIMLGTKTTCYADGKHWESPIFGQCSTADEPK